MNWALELSKQHLPKVGVANIYGIILYTNAHPHLKRILNDRYYWDALDELSGDQWAIFAVKAMEGSYEYPKVPSGALGFMVPVWKEPKENKEIIGLLELDNTKDPLLLIFNQSSNGDINKFVISIDEPSAEGAFICLKEIMQTVSTAIGQISESNLHNADAVYSALNLAIRHYKDKCIIKKGVKLLQWFKSMI